MITTRSALSRSVSWIFHHPFKPTRSPSSPRSPRTLRDLPGSSTAPWDSWAVRGQAQGDGGKDMETCRQPGRAPRVLVAWRYTPCPHYVPNRFCAVWCFLDLLGQSLDCLGAFPCILKNDLSCPINHGYTILYNIITIYNIYSFCST